MGDLLSERLLSFHPGAEMLPIQNSGGTDASSFREKGAVAYGAGAFSGQTTFAEVASRFHGIDERIDVNSLRLQTQLWLDVVTQFLA